MKKAFLMLALFLTTIGVSIAEEVWVRTYMMRDTQHPIDRDTTIPAGIEMKSYGPVDRSEVRELDGCVNLLFFSAEAYEQGSTGEEINQAIEEALSQEQSQPLNTLESSENMELKS